MISVLFYLQFENEFLRLKLQNIFDQIYMYFVLPQSPGYETLKINILRVPLTFIALPIHEKNRLNRSRQKAQFLLAHF